MGQSVGVSVTVKNTGKVAGMEVVQLVRYSLFTRTPPPHAHTHDTTRDTHTGPPPRSVADDDTTRYSI
jgi:hypothetical protein